MTTHLNAQPIRFNATSQRTSQTKTPVNHAAVAACLCALVFIFILLSPTIFSSSEFATVIGLTEQGIQGTEQALLAR